MKSKKSKKIIIICLLFIVIFVIALLLFILNKNNKTSNTEESINIEDKRYEVDKSNQKIDEKYINSQNQGNRLEIKATTQERIIKEYLEHYKNDVLNFTDDAYESLDKEYREKKFGSIEEYKQYVSGNKSELEDIELSKYQEKEYDNYTEYICIDQYDNYYIFHVTNPGNYTLFLDTYTVDLTEFTEKYNKASEQEKVVLNINKVITALNAQDYKYIYSKLADSFKNNYFKDEESLKEYLVNNLFDKNIVEFEEFAREGTLYTYKIKLTKIISEDEKEKYYGKNAPMEYVNVVMQLNEGTDFVMSFSIEE